VKTTHGRPCESRDPYAVLFLSRRFGSDLP
jgi:hypothetical protein